MHNHRPRNHFRDVIEAITLLILLGVALKKLMHWMQKQEKHKKPGGYQDNDVVAGLMKLFSQVQKNGYVSKYVRKPVDVSRQVREVKAARTSAKFQTPLKSSSNPAKNAAKSKRTAGLNARQQKIYGMFQSQGELTMQSIVRAIGSGVSSRTLRRDMTHLEKIGIISQSGRTKNSVYKLA